MSECRPPAISSPNPSDPSGPPICADWEVGPFGRVMTDIWSWRFNIYLCTTVMYHLTTYVHMF